MDIRRKQQPQFPSLEIWKEGTVSDRCLGAAIFSKIYGLRPRDVRNGRNVRVKRSVRADTNNDIAPQTSKTLDLVFHASLLLKHTENKLRAGGALGMPVRIRDSTPQAAWYPLAADVSHLGQTARHHEGRPPPSRGLRVDAERPELFHHGGPAVPLTRRVPGVDQLVLQSYRHRETFFAAVVVAFDMLGGRHNCWCW